VVAQVSAKLESRPARQIDGALLLPLRGREHQVAALLLLKLSIDSQAAGVELEPVISSAEHLADPQPACAEYDRRPDSIRRAGDQPSDLVARRHLIRADHPVNVTVSARFGGDTSVVGSRATRPVRTADGPLALLAGQNDVRRLFEGRALLSWGRTEPELQIEPRRLERLYGVRPSLDLPRHRPSRHGWQS